MIKIFEKYITWQILASRHDYSIDALNNRKARR